LEPVLYVHRADRADRLLGALAGVLQEPLADPFAAEVVAVPTHGVERWLSQQLSASLGAGERGDGVCANVEFPSPRDLIDEVLAAASGFDAERDPWSPRRLLWPLLETIDQHLAEVWLSMLRSHLDPARGDRSRRLRVAEHLAGLYDRYAVYRPELLNGWLAGDEDQQWQAELWRRLRARLDCAGPAERLGAACEALLANPDLTTLPARISLFGLTSLPVRHLQVMRALAEGGRDVHLFVLAPSTTAWQKITRVLGEHDIPVLRGEAGNELLPKNPLLASWGRDGREFQLVLAGGGEMQEMDHATQGGEPLTLLSRLQADIRADRAPEGRATADGSLQVHACHGAARQVEVLRDAVLHALSEDHTLEPRDVIVMCPDIERFAPLIEATFGAGATEEDDPAADQGPTAGLRVRLADRSLRHSNPVLAVLARLLELVGARMTASEMLDIADREPVRARFNFTPEDMGRIGEWVAGTGTRWGFDAEDRARFGLLATPQGTWAAGLDRLLTGVVLGGEDPPVLHGVSPYEDLDSSSIDLAGRLAEYLERLHTVIVDFRGRRPLEAWASAAAGAVDSLCATTGANAPQRTELERLLRRVVEEATVDGLPSDVPLDVADFSALLGDRLAGRPTRANFRTGHLTFCTLQPMRSVPHRVICLLGLDDTVFPRRSARDGDDILLERPRVGERDPRSEDRQILLDALMAATDRLIITYTGSDERTNAQRAPAVPIAELLDVVERCSGDGEVVTRHPLQPFDPVNFQSGALLGEGPWSFDTGTLDGARALLGERVAPARFLPGPLPAVEHGGVIELERLISFLAHPVRGFLRQRLGIGAAVRAREIKDRLPLELDSLECWEIGERLLSARLRGAEAADAVAAERARGSVSPGMIGSHDLALIASLVEQVVTQAQGALDLESEQQTLDARIGLGDGRLIAGTISGLRGNVVQHVGFFRIGPRQRLAAWARLLILAAAFPERTFSTATVGRTPKEGSGPPSVTIARAGIPASLRSAQERETWARQEIDKLIDLFDRGLREPLPLYCRTSAALAAGPAASARERAEEAWTTAWTKSGVRVPREGSEQEHTLVLDGERPFDELLAEAPREDEDWFGGRFDARLECYAHRLWDGLIAAETVSRQ
jgi:exodeoxyribonuclease V gamma subunit